MLFGLCCFANIDFRNEFELNGRVHIKSTLNIRQHLFSHHGYYSDVSAVRSTGVFTSEIASPYDTWFSFCQHRLSPNPASMSDCIPSKIWEWLSTFTPHFMKDVISYRSMDGGYWTNFLRSVVLSFLPLWRHNVAIEYPVYIWQVLPQLSCDDTCQIWMWYEEFNMSFCHIGNFAYREINERSFSKHHPWC